MLKLQFSIDGWVEVTASECFVQWGKVAGNSGEEVREEKCREMGQNHKLLQSPGLPPENLDLQSQEILVALLNEHSDAVTTHNSFVCNFKNN